MLSAIIVALREGVEAALVVGIVLVYLNRTGRRALGHYVWSGLAVACAASFAAAILLQRWQISEDGFEGVLMLAAAVLVISMIVWMNRIARHLRKNIESRVERFAQKSELAAGLGIAFFVFLMVLREGAELILILRAVDLSASGLQIWIGTAMGIILAVAVGIFFFQGTLKVPLGRFFAATSAILIVVAIQLAITGLHEMSEAKWLPSSAREMAIVGPIVSNEYFFFVLILAVSAIVVLREWFALRASTVQANENAAERRLRQHEHRRRRLWAAATGFLCLVVIFSFTAEFVYTRVSAAAPEAQQLFPTANTLRIPISQMDGASVRFYSVDVNGALLRFMVIRKPGGTYSTALDACQICGNRGFRQQGATLICRNCGAPINVAEVGLPGGCNPVGFPSQVQGSDLVINLSAVSAALSGISK